MTVDQPRPITEHLEEIRRRVLIILAWFIISFIVVYPFVDSLLDWLAKPVGQFVFIEPTEAFFIRIKVGLAAGAVLCFPFFLYQLWRFVEVALTARERSIVVVILPPSLLLFAGGAALALFGIVPLATKYLLTFGTPNLRPMISASAYLGFITWMVLGFGLFFQLPLVVVMLAKAGVVEPAALALYRKHVVVLLLVVAALLTPGPDVLSQLVLTIPAYFLFECALIVARRVAPKS